ncbi:unnamed protein product [Ectocarpus sp. CCAP 1310/34]|nr:unnamed protein product [Ectocarpus sp. CCAP 1310/34]
MMDIRYKIKNRPTTGDTMPISPVFRLNSAGRKIPIFGGIAGCVALNQLNR